MGTGPCSPPSRLITWPPGGLSSGLRARIRVYPPGPKIDALPEAERWQVEFDLETKDHLEAQIQRLTDRLATLSQQEPWVSQALLLMQLPGFGLITTMIVLAAIGDISRFPSPKHLVTYAGLAPGIHCPLAAQAFGRHRGVGRANPSLQPTAPSACSPWSQRLTPSLALLSLQ